ncbi:MAG: hypothetical protein PHQ75_03945 [Thermoguttaceae bacterium]|nr:hypothetical protein [Thermoguttaceae bacterium]
MEKVVCSSAPRFYLARKNRSMQYEMWSYTPDNEALKQVAARKAAQKKAQREE